MSEQPKRPDGTADARPAKPLRLDVELLPEQTDEDTDLGWGARPEPSDAAADLRRFLHDKPPHHGS